MSDSSTSSNDARRWPRKLVVMSAAVGVIASMTTALPGAAQAAKAPTAVAPTSVSFTLQGCRNDGSITLPNSGGQYVCPDGVYTSGNLGKGWAELDLVPYRLTAKASNSAPSTQTYTIAYVVDKEDAGKPGYDVLSAAQLNTSLSDASCQTATLSASKTLTPGIGGISSSLYREFTVTQSQGATCVYDYYARLALGSHLFPGASLHANLGLVVDSGVDTGGIGAKDVSIPVNEIEPQGLSKDMAASRGSDHTWNVTKQATPASVNLGNTCDVEGDNVSVSIDETVSWTKSDAIPGAATITTNVYATNPSSRTVRVTAGDKIYSGSTQTDLLDSVTFDDTNIPPRTTLLVGTHTYSWPNPTTTSVNDVATASYTDLVTSVPIPGTTTATANASIQNTGPVTNASAVVDDTEVISGAGLQFSVDSASGATGAFSGYTLGTPTTDPVVWTSSSQSDSGSVVFRKTIYAAKGSIEPSGLLSDTAKARASDGYVSAEASASVNITVDTRARLAIDKSIPSGIITNGLESATFKFDVHNPDDTIVASPSVKFQAGETGKVVNVNNLAPGIYTVSERTATNWNANSPQQVDLSGDTCTGTVTFVNTPVPATVSAMKVTVPSGFAKGWTMALYRGDDTVPLATGVTDDSGMVSLGSISQEGTYRVEEESQTGWQSDGGQGCQFTVDLPADGGKNFTCTYTNTFQPTVKLTKTGNDLSKVGDKVNYHLTLENTSPTSASSGSPSLTCEVVDATVGFDETVTLAGDDSRAWGPLSFTIPSGSDPFVNRASATCAYPGSKTTVATANANWSTNLFQPKVSVTKQADRAYAQVGDTITYTVTIENTGSADSPALIPDDTAAFVDPLVPGVTLPSSCNSLDVGQKCQVSYEYVVKADDSVIPNTATVLFHPSGFPNDVKGSASASVTVIHPAFTITKTCATPDFPPGSTVIFRVDVTNTGDVPVNIVLDDSVDGNGNPLAPYPLTGANTTATVTSGITNADLTFTDGRVSFTLPVGVAAQLEISLQTQNYAVINSIMATGTLPKTYGGTSYNRVLTAQDTCMDAPTGATRTIGFWKTHLSFTRQVLNLEKLPAAAVLGTSPLGVGTGGAFINGSLCLTASKTAFKLQSLGDVMGIFYSSNSVNSNGSKRSALCQAKITTGKQLLGAILNQSFSNPAPLPTYGGKDLITAALTAMDGKDATLLRTLGTLLDEYNRSGDNQSIIIGGALTIGKADPKAAEAAANLKAGDC